MEDKYFKAFTVIVAFVDDLHGVFGNGKTPLDLYHRLTDHIKARDIKAISRIVRPFEDFVVEYRDLITSGEISKIPRNTVISYENSDRVYIEIQKFIYKGDVNVKSSIHRHLLAISAVLTPDEKILQEFENKMSEDTPEAQMINSVIEKIGAIEPSGQDPMGMITQVLSGGLVQDLFTTMQEGVGSGEMDIGKLMGTLQNTIGALQGSVGQKSPPPERPKILDITDEKPPSPEPELD